MSRLHQQLIDRGFICRCEPGGRRHELNCAEWLRDEAVDAFALWLNSDELVEAVGRALWVHEEGVRPNDTSQWGQIQESTREWFREKAKAGLLAVSSRAAHPHTTPSPDVTP